MVSFNMYEDCKSTGRAKGEDKDCTVIAVALTCRVPYEVAHAAMRAAGRVDRKGANFFATMDAVKSLGYDCEQQEKILQPNGSAYTQRSISKKLKRGYWICHVNHHVFAVVNGMVLDWSKDNRHRIDAIYKISKKRKQS